MVDLSFPDTGHHVRGEWIMQTVEAMRKAKGDRLAAAKALGIPMSTLTCRLTRIRQEQVRAKA